MTEQEKEKITEAIPKVESRVKFEDRKKVLTHITTVEREIMKDNVSIGKLTTESRGVYPEAGIRNVVKDLNAQKITIEKSIKTLNEDLKKAAEMGQDKRKVLIELRDNLNLLKEFDAVERKEQMLKEQQQALKQANKGLSDIKAAVGTKIKF